MTQARAVAKNPVSGSRYIRIKREFRRPSLPCHLDSREITQSDDPEAQQRDPFTHQDDDGHPPRQFIEVAQTDERLPGECLVSERICDLAERGDQTLLAGQRTVGVVGD